MPISKELYEILACPKCKGPLDRVEEPEGFACPACKLLYKIEDNIPNFLIEEALPLRETKAEEKKVEPQMDKREPSNDEAAPAETEHE